MEKITFKVILRMPNYYSKGLLQLTEVENKKEQKVKALFTIDKAVGGVKDGIMELAFLKHDIDSTLNVQLYGLQFTINVGELVYPMKYFFTYENDCENYSIEFVSVEKNISNIKFLESVFR